MTERATQCPACEQGGAAVDRITLKALLTADGLRRGIPEHPRYCATPDCPIVYFDADGSVTFTEADLVVPVYAKHPNDPKMPVCYCFRVHREAMLDRERAHELRKMVAAEVKAGNCACEVRNPKGECCLGDLVQIERDSEQAATAASCCPTT